MTESRFRFSILQLLEFTANLGLALAAGKSSGDYSERYLAPLAYLCGLLGAYSGFRWFPRDSLAWCGLKTFAISIVTTTAGLAAFELSNHEPVRQWDFAVRRFIGLVLVGGILGACLVLYAVLLGKVFKRKTGSCSRKD
jgi:hypothetical protein